jgi:hypothetical protein
VCNGISFENFAVIEPPREIMEMYDEVREKELVKLADKGMENKDNVTEATNPKGSKKSDIIDYIAKSPPPTGKKEKVEYIRHAAKELSCTENFIYKVLRNTL